MTAVVKTVKFDAAQVLTNHQGLCKNLHGHTYRVDVSVRRGHAPQAAEAPSAENTRKGSSAESTIAFSCTPASGGTEEKRMAGGLAVTGWTALPTSWSASERRCGSLDSTVTTLFCGPVRPAREKTTWTVPVPPGRMTRSASDIVATVHPQLLRTFVISAESCPSLRRRKSCSTAPVLGWARSRICPRRPPARLS